MRGLNLRRRLAACDRIVAAGAADASTYELRSRLRLFLGDCAGGWRDVLTSIAFDPPESANYSQGLETPTLIARPPRTELGRRLSPGTPAPVWFMIEALTREVRRRPDHAAAWAWRGALKRRLSDYAGAVADLSRAERLGLVSSTLLTWRGEAKIQILDFRGGRRDLEAALKRPCESWNHAWCGRSLLTYLHDRRALRHLDRAIALSPNYGFYYAWRALAKLRLGMRAGVLADLRTALARDRGGLYRPEILCWRGLARQRDGAHREASADFDRAIRAQPDFAVALHARAQSRRAVGRLAGWIEDFDRAAHLRPKHLQSIEAASAQELGAMEEDLSRVLKSAPAHAAARRWRGLCRLRLGRLDAARDDLDRAVRRDAREPWAWVWRGELAALQGDAVRALRSFDRAIAVSGGTPPALLGRARALIALGKFAPALRAYDRAALLDPHWAAVFAERGALRLLLGRPREALADLEYAQGRTGGYANLHADLAVARGLLGDAARARGHWRRALALDRPGAQARLSGWREHWSSLGAPPPAALRRLLSSARRPS